MKLADRASIVTELKRKTSFGLRKNEYASILTRLHDGNAVLITLAKQNSDLEPTRRSRSQTKAVRLIRRLSAGIFSGIQESMTCNCMCSHDLGLVMAPRNPVLTSETEEEETAKLQFEVVLGTYEDISQRWDGMRVIVADKKISPQVPTSPPRAPKSTTKRLRWASQLSIRPPKVESPSPPSQAPHAIPANCSSNTASPRPPITNLCQVLLKGKDASSECYGMINGRSDVFELYHHEMLPSFCSAITLRDILSGNGGAIDNFGIRND